MKFIDLTGKRFGNLLVLHRVNDSRKRTYYLCKCDCGKEKVICAGALTSGHTKTCGCCNDSTVHYTPFIDLTGKKFGKLTVLSYNKLTKKWLCKCDCGNIKEIMGAHLKSGATKTCGCSNRDSRVKNLIGQKFGKWVVLERDYSIPAGRGAYWKCQCDCGTIKSILGTTLIRGLSKSCGCARADVNRSWCLQDLTGQKFGKLTVLYQVENHGRYVMWHCKCDCGNEVDVAAGHLRSGHTQSCGCSYVYHNGSIVENEIKQYVENITKLHFYKVRILDGKEIDMYNEELKLGIEYNGSYFHANINNVRKNKSKNYHQAKFLLAKEKGIHLINIFDVEYANNKDKILAYISDIINPKHKIYARQCDIQKIDKYIAWEFYDKYHLQKHNNFTQINYGLYYNNELIAVMGFGKLRMKNANKENNYELHRYCVKHGYKIIGGSQKLFKHFIEEYNPQYIKSYSDNNYFLGSMYEKLGFVYKGQASISYFWVLNNKKLKREQCQVKKLKELYLDIYNKAIEENVSNKEDYIMTQLGACKVYTAGNSIWEYNKEI